MSFKNNISDPENDFSRETPHFERLSNNNPFRTEIDYFSDFESKLNEQIEEFEELKLIAPELCRINKYNPFEVPENYFDELPIIIQQHTVSKRAENTFIETLLLLIQPRFIVPVFTTLLIAFLGIRYINSDINPEANKAVPETSVEEQLYQIDEATIIETLTAENTQDAEATSDENAKIENYLIENNIEESNLSEAL